MDPVAALERARTDFDAALANPQAAMLPRVWRARRIPAVRVLGVIPRSERFRPAGSGVLFGPLLALGGEVFAVDALVVASRRVLPGHQAASARARRELREQLARSGFPDGASVAVDARRIPLDDAEAMAGESWPLVLTDRGVQVRWMRGAPDEALRPLADYLDERMTLALTLRASDEDGASGEERP